MDLLEANKSFVDRTNGNRRKFETACIKVYFSTGQLAKCTLIDRDRDRDRDRDSHGLVWPYVL